MKRLLIALLIPLSAYADDTQEIIRNLLAGQNKTNQELNTILRESYIQNGTVYGDAAPLPTNDIERMHRNSDIIARRAAIEHAESEAAKRNTIKYPWGSK